MIHTPRSGLCDQLLSSCWLAALCKQLLCLKVTARYLGSDCGLKLGRQADWRPGIFGMVLSSWLAALCKQLLCFKSNCEVLGLWLRAQTRSSSCLAPGVQSEWCCQSGTSGRSVDGGDVVHLWARSCAMRSRRGAQLVRLSSRGSIRSRSRARSTRWEVSAEAGSMYDARGPLTKTGMSLPCKSHCFLSFSVNTVKTQCCGSHPCGPTVDRHSSVNSGARYA